MSLPQFIEIVEYHNEYFNNGELKCEHYQGIVRKGNGKMQERLSLAELKKEIAGYCGKA